MPQNKDPRHEARKVAMASIFNWMFSPLDEQNSLSFSKDALEVGPVDQNLALKIVHGVEEHSAEINTIIEEAAPEWPLDKISKVDLAILKIAIFELLYNDDVPTKVAIDEAVELAKEFGNDTSSKFVNGVLGGVVDDEDEIDFGNDAEEDEQTKHEKAVEDAVRTISED